MNWPYLTIGQPVVDEVFKKYEFSSQLILIIFINFNNFQYISVFSRKYRLNRFFL